MTDNLKIMSSLKRKKKLKKREPIPSNELVFQHNNLIESRYFLSLTEKKILLWIMSEVNPYNEDLGTQSISIREFASMIGVSPNSKYSQMRKVTMSLRNRGLNIKNLDTETLTQIGWLHRVDYLEKEGVVEFQLHPFLKPFLQGLKSKFTALPMSEMMGLRSIYSIRFFELLKQYESIGHRTISIEELRDYCGIKTKFKKYNDLKKYVLEVAKKELKNKTNISFEFEEIKRSRRIISIKFNIRARSPHDDLREESSLKNIRKEINSRPEIVKVLCNELGFSPPTAYKYVNSYDEERVKDALKITENMIQKGQAKEPKAIFKTAIKEGWKP